MRPPRLAWPLAVSLLLHIGAAGLFSPWSTGYPAKRVKAATLTVTLAQKSHAPRSEPRPVPKLADPALQAAAGSPTAKPAETDPADALSRKARFLAAPDLSILEEIPLIAAGSVTLRLEVSALGTVDRVIVVNSDPVPKELLDGLVARFRNSRLAPALAGEKPVPSSLDLVIRYEPAPEILPR